MFERKGRRFSPTRLLARLFLILLTGSIVTWILLKVFLPTSHHPPPQPNTDDSHCLIPQIPLRSKQYNQTLSVPTISQCQNVHGVPPVNFLQNGTLTLLPNNIYTRDDCTAFEILRPNLLPTDKHLLRKLDGFDGYNQIHSVTSPYVMVACDNVWTNTLHYTYLSRVVLTEHSIRDTIEHWDDERGQGLPVNVMVLVLDSISATDAARNLPMTMDFLLGQDFIPFPKFHSVGEPTMLNILPLLTGTSAHVTFETRYWTDYWDDNYFIWKDFQTAHYLTTFIEDVPFVGTFNYGFQSGFSFAPVDIYPRPLFTAWEMNKKGRDYCIGDTSLWKYILNMELEIFRTLDGIVPIFSLPWLTWPFHDHFGTLSLLDHDLLSFFQNITSSTTLVDNSVLILMSDHGYHSAKYSETYEGLLERRLPLLMIRIPHKLNELIPNVGQILGDNSDRVVSHFDLYKTLFHIAQLGNVHRKVDKDGDKDDSGHSLFEPIPAGRTCREAQVPDGWCACNLPGPPAESQSIPSDMMLNVEPFHLLRLRDMIG